MDVSNRKVVIVGSANIDLVTRVARSPKPGESLIGRSFMTVTGGKGANQAVAAARLGAATVFIGCVGADAFGAMQRDCLAAAGVDVGHLKSHPTEPTGTAVILVADEGQNSIVVTPAANLGLLPEDVWALEPVIAAADALLLQLEIRLDTVETALDIARKHNVLAILDAGPAQAVPESLIAKADIVSPNETEAEAMTGMAVTSIEEARNAAVRLRAMGACEVVMKLGARGAFYLAEDELHVPAFRIEPVDTTAAGDAFNAALALAWNALPLPQALRFANAAGALAAMTAGAQPSMPTHEAVSRFLADRP